MKNVKVISAKTAATSVKLPEIKTPRTIVGALECCCKDN